MLFNSRQELTDYMSPSETFTYNGGVKNGIMFSTVSNEDGEVILHTTLSSSGDRMVVTDFRTGEIKEEPISVSSTLDEIAEDMRQLGYLTRRQTLTLGGIDLEDEYDEDDEYQEDGDDEDNF